MLVLKYETVKNTERNVYKILFSKGDSSSTKEVRLLRFFVKTTPIRNEEKKAKVLRFFMKERQIYTDLFAELFNQKNGGGYDFCNYHWCSYYVSHLVSIKIGELLWRPKCYLVRENCLVLEDLIDLGYKSITAYESQFTVSHIECILKCLAKMHADSLVSESRGIDIKAKYGHLLKEEYVTKESFQIQSELKVMRSFSFNFSYFPIPMQLIILFVQLEKNR